MEYQKLEVWQETRKLTNLIYNATSQFPKNEIFGLTNQMRRSAVSVPSNIAEGCGRQTAKDTLHFLHIARGSLYELETQCFVAKDQLFIDNSNAVILLTSINSCKRLIHGFINYYRKKLP